MSVIKARTLQGKDVNGENFEKYSKDYGDFKREGHGKGRGRDNKKGRNVYATAVNLTQTGRMLGSMATTNISNGSKIYFADPDRKAIAAYHNTGAGDLPQREFFGLSETELKRLSDAMYSRIKARVGK